MIHASVREAKLYHGYVTVSNGTELFYGGNQRAIGHSGIQKYGCGLIAATDLLIYLQRTYIQLGLPIPAPELGPVPLSLYQAAVDSLRRDYFPLIPGFGLNVWVLSQGLNRLFRKKNVPLKASWGVPQKVLWRAIDEMLCRDFPVILCIGHNFPRVWSDHKVAFYKRSSEGAYTAVAGAAAHYVVVTGMDGHWLRISSWGRELYIDQSELMTHMRSNSNPLFTNVIYLRNVKRP